MGRRNLFLIFFSLFYILGFSNNAKSLDLSLRISSRTSWDYGWKETFFFRTFSMNDLYKGNLNFDRIMRNTEIPRFNLVVTTPLGRKFNGGVILGYNELLNLNLTDSASFSFMKWQKTLDSKISIYSAGLYLGYHMSCFTPFITTSVGYVRANLQTGHIYENPGHPDLKESVMIEGTDSGLALDFQVGTTINLSNSVRFFVCGGYYQITNLDDFDSNIRMGGTRENTSFLIQSDRKFNPIHGPYIELGIEFGLSSFR